MTVFIALLRAVNVGGTGKLPMAELRAICESAGFLNVRTYIASGNVIFETGLAREKAKARLESGLQAYAGKPVGVIMRTPDEMKAVLQANPFPEAVPNRTVVIFFAEVLSPDCLAQVKGRRDERLHLAQREIYVEYGVAMADSKLVIPAAKTGTGRNMNTVAKLVEMAAA